MTCQTAAQKANQVLAKQGGVLSTPKSQASFFQHAPRHCLTCGDDFTPQNLDYTKSSQTAICKRCGTVYQQDEQGEVEKIA